MASLLPNTLPLAMLMELTHRCPLRCAYCSNPLALSPGDALTFRGDIPHGPEKLLRCPIRFLSVLMYPGAVE